MPLQKLQFKPGVNRDQTNYANEGGWFACDKIRFRSNYPQKIGGWLKYTVNTLIGACRQMFGWTTTFGDNLLALGTNQKVYIDVGGNLYDITPLRATYTTSTTPTTDNCFDTTSGSTTVNVNIVTSGAAVGDWVTFSGVVGPIGGIPQIEFNTSFKIASVVDVDNFTIQTTTAATSTTSNEGGTAITAKFQIPVGFPITTFGYGWGTSTWGRGAWGSGSTVPVSLQQQDWFFDQFDNDLIMNIRNGPLYIWERGSSSNPSTALDTNAILLSDVGGATDVPTEVTQALVSQNDKHLLAFGATPYLGSDFDPLLIRWASQNAPENWTPGPTSSAGFLRVSRGSKIIRAIPTRQEILVFTDATLNSMQFTGTTSVFSLTEMSDNISIISPRAVSIANNTTYWMGKDKFYFYTGSVQTLPSTLRNHVFEDINYGQIDQVICSTNEGWNEIWWFYPSANSQYNNKYVIYNHLEKIWYYGDIERSAWLDSPLRQYPQSVYTDPTTWSTGIIYDQERGTNDDTLPMASYIQSSDFDLEDGTEFMLIKRIIPDISFQGSTAATPTAYVTIKPRNFPGANYQTEAEEPVVETTSIPVEQYTNQVFIRARARQMAFKASSIDLNVQWQLGNPRLDGQKDGKR
jgi:hypothetical protein